MNERGADLLNKLTTAIHVTSKKSTMPSHCAEQCTAYRGQVALEMNS